MIVICIPPLVLHRMRRIEYAALHICVYEHLCEYLAHCVSRLCIEEYLCKYLRCFQSVSPVFRLCIEEYVRSLRAVGCLTGTRTLTSVSLSSLVSALRTTYTNTAAVCHLSRLVSLRWGVPLQFTGHRSVSARLWGAVPLVDPASVSLSSLVSALKNTSVSTSVFCRRSLCRLLPLHWAVPRQQFVGLCSCPAEHWVGCLIPGPCISVSCLCCTLSLLYPNPDVARVYPSSVIGLVYY